MFQLVYVFRRDARLRAKVLPLAAKALKANRCPYWHGFDATFIYDIARTDSCRMHKKRSIVRPLEACLQELDLHK